MVFCVYVKHFAVFSCLRWYIRYTQNDDGHHSILTSIVSKLEFCSLIYVSFVYVLNGYVFCLQLYADSSNITHHSTLAVVVFWIFLVVNHAVGLKHTTHHFTHAAMVFWIFLAVNHVVEPKRTIPLFTLAVTVFSIFLEGRHAAELSLTILHLRVVATVAYVDLTLKHSG